MLPYLRLSLYACIHIFCLLAMSNYEQLLQVASHVMLGIPKNEEAPPTPQHPLSAMGDACSRMDLTAIHQILVMTHYKDDEGTNELSFQEWTQINEGYVRGKKAWRLGISGQGL
ncbi:hypothetical protein HAX54_049627 [Datura stramonium]|uniref:Serine/threonine-protein kinase BSK1-like TPR repeats domain-containing protein n=1 Tax=Datura stramonium TaxID=4076 RepID=A0ABS8SVT3_DATST|nr:hypothetical protein [Datura stramonium]